MGKDAQQPLVPKLRFPEFREPWERAAIAPLLEECSFRVAAPTILPIYTSSRAGLKPQAEYYGGRTINNRGEYGVVPADCFVFRHMSDDGVFAFHLNDTGGDIAVSKEYPVFRAVGIDRHFLLAKLNHSPDFKAFALSQKAGGTRTRLYFSKLRAWETLLPSEAEQQKIAECLTSLDELIAAQARKVELLKDHKKGLMQRLFPREGERVPKLRFGGFEGEWEERHLISLADYENGKAYEPDIQDGGKYVVVNSRFVSTDGAVRKTSNAQHCIAHNGDVLMVLSDLPNGRALAKCFYAERDDFYAVNQRIARLKPFDVHPKFFYFRLNRNHHLLSYDDGLNQTHLSKAAVTNCPLFVPTSQVEQKRLADCLSALDDQIAAEAEKTNALHTHKRGLMQQLFPKTN